MAKFQGGGKASAGAEVKNAIMTGVSWMLPFVIAGAVLMGIARDLAEAILLQVEAENEKRK